MGISPPNTKPLQHFKLELLCTRGMNVFLKRSGLWMKSAFTAEVGVIEDNEIDTGAG